MPLFLDLYWSLKLLWRSDGDVVRAKPDILTLVNVESLGGVPQQQHENMITSKDAR